MLKLSRNKPPSAKSTRRREELRRMLPQPSLDFRALLQKPEVINATLILIGFLAVCTVLVTWSQDQVKVSDGQVMTQTRLKRLDYRVEDVEQTLAAREEARKSAPRIYRLNDSYLARLEASLMGLPTAVAGKTSIDDISLELKAEFNLNEQALQALQTVVVNNEPTQDWARWVKRLLQEHLIRTPMLRTTEYQAYTTKPRKELIMTGGENEELSAMAIELRPPDAPAQTFAQVDPRLSEAVSRANFPTSLIPVVISRLTYDPQPTILYDEEASKRRAAAEAEAVPPVFVKHARGEILYRKGETLSPEQLPEIVTEAAQFRSRASVLERWQSRIGAIGLITVLTLFLGSFATIAYPRIVRNPLRLAAICALMASMLALTVLMTAYAPMFLYPAAIGPALITAIILLVAYDQRFALLLSGLHCMLTTLALEQSIGFFILLIAGCATAIAQLREVRHRNSLIRAATGTGGVLGAGTVLLGLLEVPLVSTLGVMNAAAIKQILVMAFSAVLTSYGVSFLVLGILPSIEKLFDITTGMTLAELRDPKRPLLRQLQQRAPGTYNHSLQVANIAEAAAEAIGADSLLVYVGALYHDIGKINKPEYFVENQGGRNNRHDKLSPAMSLLVITGHVKNGLELAREYGLPRSIQHFIESHHGTTLVEYFYHAAKSQAQMNDEEVAEVEYRYPGPKPRSKEAAILMLADAVESASRSLAEPNPGSIDNLVRKLSAKRLQDGQFDDCELSFRDLSKIEDAIISRMLAIYHSRISYPGGGQRGGEAAEPPAPLATPQARPVPA